MYLKISALISSLISAVVGVVLGAGLSGDGEALRNRHTGVGHLGGLVRPYHPECSSWWSGRRRRRHGPSLNRYKNFLLIVTSQIGDVFASHKSCLHSPL